MPTTTRVTTSSATTTPSSLLSTWPETGRGHASLWTAAAAPDHRLWTTLRGSGGPLLVAHIPPPTTAVACRQRATNSNQSKERRLTQHTSCRPGTGENPEAQTGGPFPSIEVGHPGLSKANQQAGGVHELARVAERLVPSPWSFGVTKKGMSKLTPSSGSLLRSYLTKKQPVFGVFSRTS